MTHPAHFGDYKVVSELGSGTISVVYEAVAETLGRRVAIKTLKGTIPIGSTFAAQLEREARVLAGLSHPNVVMLIDFVKNAEQMYLVLEYLSGHALAEVLSKKQRMRPEYAAAVGLEVARALAHAHERGVIHRDVKPANVILTKHGDVKLVDFSVAHRERLPTADEPLATPTATFGGTPTYMAPEQILGDTVDARSDVFSLGVVLYQMLAGVRPFDRPGDKPGTGHAGRRRPATPLHELVPEIPRSLERIVVRCLEKLPSDRPTAHALVAELEEFLRRRTDVPRRELVRGTLAMARLLGGDVSKITVLPQSKASSVWQSPWSFGFLTLILAVGLGLVRVTDPDAAQPHTAVEGALDPAKRGFVHVLATPWAEVAIDGQKVDATPIARAIPLSPGPHFVTFTHPAAPSETRRVVVEAGKTSLVDVTMNVTLGPGARSADGGTP
ncbi:MAG TPA: serine/threonine-protein kinase [Polyangiaceae bacterium]